MTQELHVKDEPLVFGTAQYIVETIRDSRDGPVVVDRRVVNNVVTAIGKKNIMRLAAHITGGGGQDTTARHMDQMRIGTSGAAATSADTNVKSPVTGTLTTCDSKTMSGRTLVLVNSYKSGSGSISATGIREVAILSRNTSPGGSAFSRAVFSSVNKTVSDKLKITYKCRIS